MQLLPQFYTAGLYREQIYNSFFRATALSLISASIQKDMFTRTEYKSLN